MDRRRRGPGGSVAARRLRPADPDGSLQPRGLVPATRRGRHRRLSHGRARRTLRRRQNPGGLQPRAGALERSGHGGARRPLGPIPAPPDHDVRARGREPVPDGGRVRGPRARRARAAPTGARPLFLLVPIAVREYRSPDSVTIHGALAAMAVAVALAPHHRWRLRTAVPAGVLLFAIHKLRSPFAAYAIAAALAAALVVALRARDRPPLIALVITGATFAALEVPWRIALDRRARDPRVIDRRGAARAQRLQPARLRHRLDAEPLEHQALGPVGGHVPLPSAPPRTRSTSRPSRASAARGSCTSTSGVKRRGICSRSIRRGCREPRTPTSGWGRWEPSSGPASSFTPASMPGDLETARRWRCSSRPRSWPWECSCRSC
jgi:hypothetical protein